MLSSAFTAGCATPSKTGIINAYQCEQPPLKGDTWADLAILSVEQKTAIDVCNIRNGVDPIDQANAKAVKSKTSSRCQEVGVAVGSTDTVTGQIVRIQQHDFGRAENYCGLNNIGCATKVGPHQWEIHYEPYDWVFDHEVCHALYEEMGHTAKYLMDRQ